MDTKCAHWANTGPSSCLIMHGSTNKHNNQQTIEQHATNYKEQTPSKKQKNKQTRQTKNIWQETPSHIYFQQMDGWGAQGDWHFNLPRHEDPLGCAIGDTWAVVATSQQFIRVFSYGGVQRGFFVCILSERKRQY